jgi:Na+/H+ antiporter NhaD/arsenite permease-like protein
MFLKQLSYRYYFWLILFIFLFGLTIDIQSLEHFSPVRDSVAATISISQEAVHKLPEPYMVLPFFILLLMIATGPIFYSHFWEHHYPKISVLLGLIPVFYYLFFLKDTVSLLHSTAEYISFIALLGSLFIASGGILIRVEKKSTPLVNTIFLFIGAVLANIIGTTGASMVLIRPFIRLNRNRIRPYHIVFFIFTVSNIGGSLTPIGDPPLFLGFLKGINFFWFAQNLWYIWLPTIALVLVIFYLTDMRNKYQGEDENTYSGKIVISGARNFIYLGIILISVFLDPAVISWIPSFYPLPFGIREIIMILVMVVSYKTADVKILRDNEFDFEPIREVAFLFIGIFATMVPALQLISYESKLYGQQLNAGVFFWATGTLSAFLDNAPTFLNFLSAAMGKFSLDLANVAHVKDFLFADTIYLKAISTAAVFFGAMTYIGNGPNFMVKAISEKAGIEMPSFFAYLFRYGILILLPIYFLVWLAFFS